MPDLFYLITKWRKQIIIIVALSLVVVGILVFLCPNKYLSESTALPASSYTTDKASIFNRNIQELYSALGTTDDLDMIVGAAQRDTVYLATVDNYDLTQHYKTGGTPAVARQKAAYCLKKNSKVMKSAYGELKVMVWDTDKNLAAQLANTIMDKLQAILQQLLNQNNMATLTALKSGQLRTQRALDSLNHVADQAPIPGMSQQEALTKQYQQYAELINEYQLLSDTKQPALLVVEKARPALFPDKPKRVLILIATAVLSFIFSLFVALILERRQKTLS